MHIAEMQLHPIDDFLNNGVSYTEGIDLFEHYGGNEFLVRHFRNTSEDISESFLRAQLSELLSSLPPAPVTSGSNRFPSQLPSQKSQHPQAIQDLLREKAKLYQEQSHLHSQLLDYTVFDFGQGRELQIVHRVFKTEEERHQAGKRIHQLEKLNREIWQKLDHYERTGELPAVPEPKDLPSDPLKLVQRRNNLRTYLSKFPLSEKAAAWEKELTQINSILPA